MKLINAIKNLKAYHIVEFKANQPDDTDIDIVSEKTDCLFSCKLGQLEEFFKRNDVEEAFTQDDDIISFISPETTLQIAGIDYKWHIEPVRNTKYKRLSKLFDMNNVDIPKERKERVAKYYTIQAAEFDKDDNIVGDIFVIQGSKSEFVGGVNQSYAMTLLRTRFEHQVKFRLTDEEPWQTMQELIDKEVFTV